MTFRPRLESWFPKAKRISHSNPPSQFEINNELGQYIQIISVQPVYEPKDKFKSLKNISPNIINYYHHNEVNTFKYTFRKDTKIQEDDTTLWWTKETTIKISNSLPSLINFYPVIDEITIDISPIQNAINTVKERFEKLKFVLEKLENEMNVDESMKSLIQGTVDPGVNGGLPKYKKFFNESFINNNTDDANNANEATNNKQKQTELENSIVLTINLAEYFLNTALKYSPNDELIIILYREQLPKLKSIFGIIKTTNSQHQTPTTQQKQQKQIVFRKNNNNNRSSNHNSPQTPKTIENRTPASVGSNRSNNKQQSSNETPIKSSFFRQLTQNTENNKSRKMIAYLTRNDSETSQNNKTTTTTNDTSSHRDSFNSIENNNEQNDTSSTTSSSKLKIILDEPVKTRRPLRPNSKLNNTRNSNTNISSPSNSTQNSRPISNLSNETTNSAGKQYK
jgi:hypothetical protein